MALKDGWELVIGLEVHCELATATKIFCGCANDFGAEPNTNICPVCLGLPGSLPVLNETVVEMAMRLGMALHCEVRPSVFHRKNYFYPDMTKDYQVSQYDRPINVDGWLDLPDGTRVGIERAHLEEDAGKSMHAGSSGRIAGGDYSLVDYNRAGVPLVEIVSRPDLRTAEQAKLYAAEIRSILVATGVSDGRMEQGSMRVDANVSVRRSGEPFGTRCEIKNLNSLRSLVRAIEYEAARQVDVIESGGRVIQETRHWSEDDGRTSSMRSKEEANDYRYFPEPDLVPLEPSPEWQERVRAALPVLPAERRRVLSEATGGELAASADAIVAVVERELDRFVTSAVAAGVPARVAVNRAANELAAAEPAALATLAPESFARVLSLEAAGALTATQAKQVLVEVLATGATPESVVAARGFEAMASSDTETLVDALIAEFPSEFARLQGGDPKIAGFFVGQAMARTDKKADGKAVTALLRSRAGL
jgi:aspartyl-tRNA(Asn)/glutamyl-tRNA(Gln) amidotransferase subunit B